MARPEVSDLDSVLLHFLSWLFLGGARTTLSSSSSSYIGPLRPNTAAATAATATTAITATAFAAFNVLHRGQSPRFTRLSRDMGSTIAYHGTALPNVWSCLQNGLLSMSGSEFQTNGAAFGDGVYLSTEESVALSFAPRFSVTKRLARLLCHGGVAGDEAFAAMAAAARAGAKLKFVFECEVVEDPQARTSDGRLVPSSAAHPPALKSAVKASSNQSPLNTYQCSPSRRQRIHLSLLPWTGLCAAV